MESNITKLKKYSSVINLNEFLDYLISIKVLDENAYYEVWLNKKVEARTNITFDIIDKKGKNVVDNVLQYLHFNYPNIESLKEDERSFRKSTVRGGFPKLPPNYVKRMSLADKVKVELEVLRHSKLVIYGMMGYGKSCLLNEVLNDLTLRKHFDNNIFWVNLGEHHTHQNVLQPMWRLYCMASYCSTNCITHCPDDAHKLKDCLKELFLDKKLENALVILDDVCETEVLFYFDVGCNMVITTQDRQILRKKEEAVFVEVNTGFSLTESMELFKKSLEYDKELPTSAEEIHYICKGHPMLIALIGSFLSDNKRDIRSNNDEIWNYVKQMLLRGNYRLNDCDIDTRIPTEIIEKCVEKLLTQEQKAMYEDLAIFIQDVNIPPEVLEILWNKQTFEVKNLMNKFAEKSLIVLFYKNDLKTFIYGIHDIHLNYLKEQTKNRITTIHQRLINNYIERTNGDFSKLPNDNYSLQFIGYHLMNAKAFEKFNIYFDLNFLEAKIKAVGKEDVVRDMEKYEEYITRNFDEFLVERLRDFKEFVKNCGSNLHFYNQTNIIQYGLQERKDSYVFKEAVSIARSSNKLFLKLQKPIENLEYPQTIHVQDDITAACFVDSPLHILVGSASGKIKLFYEQDDKSLSYFTGHNAAILHLHISPDKTHFLSVSEDRKVILWKFTADSKRNSLDHSNNRVISPKTKQKEWQDIFTPDKGQILPKKIFQSKDDDDYLISACFFNLFPQHQRIVTGSHKGNVIIWDVEEGMLTQTYKRGFQAPCVMYSLDMLMFACDDSIFKFKVDDGNSFKLTPSTPLQVKCNSFFISENKIFAVTHKNIVVFNDWEEDKKIKPIEVHKYDMDQNKSNICATITNDLRYLVISTNLKTVYIYDIADKKVIEEYQIQGLAKSLDTMYLENHSVHILLIGSDKRTLQKYHIQPCNNELNIQNSPSFLPYWNKQQSDSRPLLPLVSPENRLQIFKGYTLISETEVVPSRVSYTCFSLCGNNIIYGLKNGEVHQFTMKSRSHISLEDLRGNGRVTFLKCFCNETVLTNGYSLYNRIDTSLNYYDNNGSIIAVYDKKNIKILHKNQVLSRYIENPFVFHKQNTVIIVDGSCGIYNWNIDLDKDWKLKDNIENVSVEVVAMNHQKKLLAVSMKQALTHVLDIFYWNEDNNTVELKKHTKLPCQAVSCDFSRDGTLLAVGMLSGIIYVYNVPLGFKLNVLEFHHDAVHHLVFSNSVDPFLVSAGEQIAWWNLKAFKEIPLNKGRPKGIEVLDNTFEDTFQIDIGFWSNCVMSSTTPNLLSCVKLHGRPKSLFASNDFNSFLSVDDKGKIYILEAVLPCNT